MKTFKTILSKGAILLCCAVLLSSCATVLGGQRTVYQQTKPKPGEPKRELRVGALVANILLTGPVGVAIDFATGAAYKPAPTKGK